MASTQPLDWIIHTRQKNAHKAKEVIPIIKDLTNQRFGKLTALYPTNKRQGNHVIWHCRCDCGNEKDVAAPRLTMGLATCCGCETSRLHDLTGRRFGKLTVISRAPNSKGHGARWNCRCDCGKNTVVYASHLERGKIQSCGCQKHDVNNITGQRKGNLVALKKTGERDRFGNPIYLWKCDCGHIFPHNSQIKLITCPECLKRIKADHINSLRDRRFIDQNTGLDKTSLQNIQTGKLTRANTSGIRGVTWHKGRGKWIAYGRMNGKTKQLGAFDSMDEAKEARERFVRMYYLSLLSPIDTVYSPEPRVNPPF